MKKIINILVVILLLSSCATHEKVSSLYYNQIGGNAWLRVNHNKIPFGNYKIGTTIKRLGLPNTCDTTVYKYCHVIQINVRKDDTIIKNECQKITYIPITYDDVNKTYYLFGIKHKRFERDIISTYDRNNNIVYYFE